MRLFVSILAVLICALSVAAPTRIICIGDGVTQGRMAAPNDPEFPAVYGYRYDLWKKLIDANLSVQFVGSKKGGFQGSPDYPEYKGQSFENVHEAQYDATSIGVAWNVQRRPLAADIALIYLGMDDGIGHVPIDRTIESLRLILIELRAKNPKIKVFLGLPIPTQAPYPAMAERYITWVKEFNTPESPVTTVKLAETWVADPSKPDTCTVDWWHPNKKGDAIIAEAWFKAIKPVLTK